MCAVDNYPWKLGEDDDGNGNPVGLLDFSFRFTLRLLMDVDPNKPSGDWTMHQCYGGDPNIHTFKSLLNHMEAVLTGAEAEDEPDAQPNHLGLDKRYWKPANVFPPRDQIKAAISRLRNALSDTATIAGFITTLPADWNTKFRAPGSNEDLMACCNNLTAHGIILPFVFFADKLTAGRMNFMPAFFNAAGIHTMRSLYTGSPLGKGEKIVLLTSCRLGIFRCPRGATATWPMPVGAKVLTGNARCCNGAACQPSTRSEDFCQGTVGGCTSASDEC